MGATATPAGATFPKLDPFVLRFLTHPTPLPRPGGTPGPHTTSQTSQHDPPEIEEPYSLSHRYPRLRSVRSGHFTSLGTGPNRPRASRRSRYYTADPVASRLVSDNALVSGEFMDFSVDPDARREGLEGGGVEALGAQETQDGLFSLCDVAL